MFGRRDSFDDGRQTTGGESIKETMEVRENATRHAVTVQLKPVEQSDQPIMANFTAIAVAQGIAYLDFGFIEPGCWPK